MILPVTVLVVWVFPCPLAPGEIRSEHRRCVESVATVAVLIEQLSRAQTLLSTSKSLSRHF